jgi:RNA polymerase-binding transcription factor DksA
LTEQEIDECFDQIDKLMGSLETLSKEKLMVEMARRRDTNRFCDMVLFRREQTLDTIVRESLGRITTIMRGDYSRCEKCGQVVDAPKPENETID